jgi:predicted metalloprotease with PDZ domain
MTTNAKMIDLTISRVENSSALSFDAVFPERNKSWEAQLPVWRPGRYERANFAQYILKMVGVLEDGSEIKLEKSDLHRWIIPSEINRLRWIFQADILNAGSTFVSDDLQYVNPVNCFVYDRSNHGLGYKINLIDIPKDWDIATALPTIDGCLIANDMQHAMDSPWMASPKLWHKEYKIRDSEKEVDFHVWAYGDTPPQPEKFMEDHIAFSKSQISYFGTFPSPHYHFLYLLPSKMDVRHGVEHEDSTVIALGPTEKIQSQHGYNELVGIASHELYHSWNVKRIRPSEWMPYNFEMTSPSRLGYIAEGVTTYMGDLFLFESGCIDIKRWSTLMETLFNKHLNNPGRHNLSVAESSYDTWLDGYRPGVKGRKGSIYVEGSVLAFICDTRIMKVTEGKSSLSTAMKILWERFGKPRIGITASEYWDVLAEVAGERLDDLRKSYADGTEDTWDDLVDCMLENGLVLTKSSDEKGVVKASLTPA